MKRWLVMTMLLAACGGSSKPAAQEPEPEADQAPIENTVVEDEPPEETDPPASVITTGAQVCDQLIMQTLCMYDKTPNMPPEAKAAFMDSVKAWHEALANDATRQATIDACQMSVDAAKDGFAALGC